MTRTAHRVDAPPRCSLPWLRIQALDYTEHTRSAKGARPADHRVREEIERFALPARLRDGWSLREAGKVFAQPVEIKRRCHRGRVAGREGSSALGGLAGNGARNRDPSGVRAGPTGTTGEIVEGD